MNKLKRVFVFTSFLFYIITVATAKPFLNNGPLSLSIFSQPKSTPESHIAKIPQKSAKLQDPTTEEPTNPPPSFVEHKINKVFKKILTISQLANTLRSSENLEETNIDQNEDGYTLEDQTNPPPSFVEQKIGRVVAKLFRLSQFASIIRERLNQPNYIFEYITDKNGNESQDFSPDFDSYFSGNKDAENIETKEERDPKELLDERKTKANDEGIEALKKEDCNEGSGESPEENKSDSTEKGRPKDREDTTPMSIPEKKESKTKGNRPKVPKEKDPIEEEAYRVFLFNQEQLRKSAKNIDISNNRNSVEADKISNTTEENKEVEASTQNSLKENSSTEKKEATPEASTQNPKNNSSESSINIDFPNMNDSEDMNGVLNTLKQTAEQVGYFVLEFFASFVGLTLGAVTHINHAFHQSNNTILVGIYNSTH